MTSTTDNQTNETNTKQQQVDFIDNDKENVVVVVGNPNKGYCDTQENQEKSLSLQKIETNKLDNEIEEKRQRKEDNSEIVKKEAESEILDSKEEDLKRNLEVNLAKQQIVGEDISTEQNELAKQQVEISCQPNEDKVGEKAIKTNEKKSDEDEEEGETKAAKSLVSSKETIKRNDKETNSEQVVVGCCDDSILEKCTNKNEDFDGIESDLGATVLINKLNVDDNKQDTQYHIQNQNFAVDKKQQPQLQPQPQAQPQTKLKQRVEDDCGELDCERKRFIVEHLASFSTLIIKQDQNSSLTTATTTTTTKVKKFRSTTSCRPPTEFGANVCGVVDTEKVCLFGATSETNGEELSLSSTLLFQQQADKVLRQQQQPQLHQQQQQRPVGEEENNELQFANNNTNHNNNNWRLQHEFALSKLFEFEKVSGIWTEQMEFELRDDFLLVSSFDSCNELLVLSQQQQQQQQQPREVFFYDKIHEPRAFSFDNEFIYDNLILFATEQTSDKIDIKKLGDKLNSQALIVEDSDDNVNIKQSDNLLPEKNNTHLSSTSLLGVNKLNECQQKDTIDGIKKESLVSAELHIFQCKSHDAKQVVKEINDWMQSRIHNANKKQQKQQQLELTISDVEIELNTISSSSSSNSSSDQNITTTITQDINTLSSSNIKTMIDTEEKVNSLPMSSSTTISNDKQKPLVRLEESKSKEVVDDNVKMNVNVKETVQVFNQIAAALRVEKSSCLQQQQQQQPLVGSGSAKSSSPSSSPTSSRTGNKKGDISSSSQLKTSKVIVTKNEAATKINKLTTRDAHCKDLVSIPKEGNLNDNNDDDDDDNSDCKLYKQLSIKRVLLSPNMNNNNINNKQTTTGDASISKKEDDAKIIAGTEDSNSSSSISSTYCEDKSRVANDNKSRYVEQKTNGRLTTDFSGIASVQTSLVSSNTDNIKKHIRGNKNCNYDYPNQDDDDNDERHKHSRQHDNSNKQHHRHHQNNKQHQYSDDEEGVTYDYDSEYDVKDLLVSSYDDQIHFLNAIAQHQTNTKQQLQQVHSNESYVSVLNHCFDDIEKFIMRLQQAMLLAGGGSSGKSGGRSSSGNGASAGSSSLSSSSSLSAGGKAPVTAAGVNNAPGVLSAPSSSSTSSSAASVNKGVDLKSMNIGDNTKLNKQQKLKNKTDKLHQQLSSGSSSLLSSSVATSAQEQKTKQHHKQQIDQTTRRSKQSAIVEDDYFEILSKFKLAFNLLAKLKSCIHEPNAPELVHFLFTPLSIIVEAARNAMPPVDTSLLAVPYLSKEAIDLLANCCTSRESNLWLSLGANWTQTVDTNVLRRARLPSSFQPLFSDGWAPVICDLELIGLSRPTSSSSSSSSSIQKRQMRLAKYVVKNNNDEDEYTDRSPLYSSSPQLCKTKNSFGGSRSSCNSTNKVCQQTRQHIISNSQKMPLPIPENYTQHNYQHQRRRLQQNKYDDHYEEDELDDEYDENEDEEYDQYDIHHNQKYQNQRFVYGDNLLTNQMTSRYHRNNKENYAASKIGDQYEYYHYQQPQQQQQQQYIDRKHANNSKSKLAYKNSEYDIADAAGKQQLDAKSKNAININQYNQQQQQQQQVSRRRNALDTANNARNMSTRQQQQQHNRDTNLRPQNFDASQKQHTSSNLHKSLNNNIVPTKQQQQKNNKASKHIQQLSPTTACDSTSLDSDYEAILSDLGYQADWLNCLQERDARVVRALCSRQASNAKELTVYKGEILELIDDSRRWWKLTNIEGSIGHVPYTIVAPMRGYQTVDELLEQVKHYSERDPVLVQSRAAYGNQT